MAKTAILTFLLIPFAALAASAEESPVPQPSRPYSFSGPCTSQGSWTQAALAQTSRLREIVTQLKSDGNCTALSKNMTAALNSMDANLRSIDMENGAAGRVNQIPEEIAGLRNFAASDQGLQGKVMDNLVGRAIEQAALTAKADAVMTPIKGPVPQNAADSLMGRRERNSRAASMSLDVFTKMLDSAPQMEQCLVNPDGSAQFFAATVKVLSSYASSGQDGTGKGLAEAVAGLGKVFGREAKFADMVRQLNEQDFLVSMTCLMEVTSESFCSARDARSLYDNVMKQKAVTSRGEARSAQNPLYGYYILNEHLPVVTRWLQQVQSGVAARRPEDAAAKAKVDNDVRRFLNDVENIRSEIFASIDRIENESDPGQQRSLFLKLLRKTILLINGPQSIEEGGNPNRENFFNAAGTNDEITFRLIGESTIPQEFLDENGSRSAFAWIEATRARGFKDPRAMAVGLRQSFEEIAIKGRRAADSYFQRYFVSDQVNLINKALLGPNLNVKSALQGIDSYLAALDRKVIAQGDVSTVGTIRETRRRIRDVLAAFAEVRNFSEKLAASPRAEEEGYTEENAVAQDAELLRVSTNLLQVIQIRFDMQTSQTSFLASRLADLVNKDYELTLSSGRDFSAYHQELYQTTGQAMVDGMIRMSNGNPAQVDKDLDMAMRLNKGNLEILQRLLLNPFTAQIAFLKLIGENRQPGAWKRFWESNLRIVQERATNLPGEDRNVAWRYLGGFFGGLWTSMINSDRYPYMSPGTLFRFGRGRFHHSPDDEFGSAKKLQAQLCVQALAFNDVRPFWNLCKDTIMKTPYIVTSGLKINDENALEYLSVDFQKKAYESIESPSLNHSKRICAFRDYNRRNLVMYLTEKNR